MNHKAKRIEWDVLAGAIGALQEQQRWDDLLLLSCATFTGCRPGDWTRFTWGIFLDASGRAKDQTKIVERKPENIAKARAQKTGVKAKPKARAVFLVPRFKEILEAAWKGKGQPLLTAPIFRGGRGPRNGDGGISTNTANTRLDRLAAEFGFPSDVTTYSFRRTGARRVHDSQTDPLNALRLAQRFLNHRSADSTAAYIGLDDEETRTAFSSLAL